jgi:hypothetical protein
MAFTLLGCVSAQLWDTCGGLWLGGKKHWEHTDNLEASVMSGQPGPNVRVKEWQCVAASGSLEGSPPSFSWWCGRQSLVLLGL